MVDAGRVADCQCPAVDYPVHVLCCLHALLQQYAPILSLRFSTPYSIYPIPSFPPRQPLHPPPSHRHEAQVFTYLPLLYPSPSKMHSESLLQNFKNVRGHPSMFHIHSLNLYGCSCKSPRSSHLSTMSKVVLLYVEQ